MELDELNELALWFKDNIFDEPETSPEPENVIEEDEPDSHGLSDSARLYHWCPRRKRLVQSG